MTSSRPIAVIGVLMALVIGGCVAPVGGNAVSTGNSVTTTLPPAPREIRIDDLDPCTVLTADQLDRLRVGGPDLAPATDSRGPICQWSGGASRRVFEGYLVEGILDSGPEFAFGNRRGATVITVAGFPAVQTQGNYAPADASCVVLLGVARGQTLQIAYDYNGPPETMTKDLACTKARTAAELAMQTLIARAGG